MVVVGPSGPVALLNPGRKMPAETPALLQRDISVFFARITSRLFSSERSD